MCINRQNKSLKLTKLRQRWIIVNMRFFRRHSAALTVHISTALSVDKKLTLTFDTPPPPKETRVWAPEKHLNEMTDKRTNILYFMFKKMFPAMCNKNKASAWLRDKRNSACWYLTFVYFKCCWLTSWKKAYKRFENL